MAREFTIHVDHPDGSGQVAIGPDEEIPDWARKVVHERHLDPGDSGSPDGPPPRAGAGSSTEAWAQYAAGKVEVEDGASREAIIQALTDAGFPVDQQ